MSIFYSKKFREAGFACFPLKLNSKEPAVTEWQHCQVDTYDVDDFTGNYGVNLPPNVLVVDIDPRNYPDGTNKLAELEALIGRLPETFTVQTPQGGQHRYYTKPPVAVRKGLKSFKGLDFLSKGAFAVGVGSITEFGQYTVINGHPTQLAEAPATLLGLIAKTNTKRKGNKARQTRQSDRPLSQWTDHGTLVQWFSEYLKVCDPAIAGQNGNDTTYKVACKGWSQALSQETTLRLMRDIYNPRCQPAWSDNELASIVSNAYQYADDVHGAEAEGIMSRLMTDFDVSQLPPSPTQNNGFPLNALPSLLQQPVSAIQRLTQAPLAIAAQSVLAVTSLLVQGFVDIKLPSGQVSPCSLYFITVAESGERKSSVDKRAQAGILQWETEQYDSYRMEYAAFKQRHDVWEKLRANVLNPKRGESIELVEQKLNELGAEPEAPLIPQKTCQEPTYEALLDLMEKGQPSLALLSDEGGGLIGGYAMQDRNKLTTLGGLSDLWGAKPITRNRKGDGHRWLNGKRFSFHIMVQPVVAALLLNDELSNKQGFTGRCLTSWPDSTIGTRWMRDPDPVDEQLVDQFQARVLHWLNKKPPVRKGTRNELKPRVVTLSKKAIEVYRVFHDAVEAKLAPFDEYFCIKGLANKMVENATRLATVMAVFDNPTLEVLTAEDMQRGVALGWYYLKQALRIRQRFQKRPPQDRNIVTLTEWLTDSWSEPYITASDAKQLCPKSNIRSLSNAQINDLLEKLEASGLLRAYCKPVQINGHKRTKNVFRLVSNKPDTSVG